MQEWLIFYYKMCVALSSIVQQINEEFSNIKATIRNLELSNAHLRSKIENFEEKKNSLMKIAQLNEMDRSKLNELFGKYVKNYTQAKI